jgi:hypothetical protein
MDRASSAGRRAKRAIGSRPRAEVYDEEERESDCEPPRRRQRPNAWAPHTLVSTLAFPYVFGAIAEYLHPTTMVALSRTCRAVHAAMACRLDGDIARFVCDWRLSRDVIDRETYERDLLRTAQSLTDGWKVLPCITQQCQSHGTRARRWMCTDCITWRDIMGHHSVKYVRSVVHLCPTSAKEPWEESFAETYEKKQSTACDC